VSFGGLKLVKARVRVHQYPDGALAVFHGPRWLARYDAAGEPIAAVPTRPQHDAVLGAVKAWSVEPGAEAGCSCLPVPVWPMT
jgi:hypothetical protein